MDEFSEKFQRGGAGGEVVFNPKIYISDFGPLNRACRKKLQYGFLKMRGGGSKATWNFSENSSVLLWPPVPKNGFNGFDWS